MKILCRPPATILLFVVLLACREGNKTEPAPVPAGDLKEAAFHTILVGINKVAIPSREVSGYLIFETDTARCYYTLSQDTVYYAITYSKKGGPVVECETYRICIRDIDTSQSSVSPLTHSGLDGQTLNSIQIKLVPTKSGQLLFASFSGQSGLVTATPDAAELDFRDQELARQEAGRLRVTGGFYD